MSATLQVPTLEVTESYVMIIETCAGGLAGRLEVHDTGRKGRQCLGEQPDIVANLLNQSVHVRPLLTEPRVDGVESTIDLFESTIDLFEQLDHFRSKLTDSHASPHLSIV